MLSASEGTSLHVDLTTLEKWIRVQEFQIEPIKTDSNVLEKEFFFIESSDFIWQLNFGASSFMNKLDQTAK
jgi:hypothetical protein